VVKDYHFTSMIQEITPQLFTMKNANSFGTYFIKIKPNTQTASLKLIQKTFKKWYPLSPYSYVFKNDLVKQDYEAEAKWKQIILFGAIITIFISCIGLFGLSVLSAEKRTKEIGIRKVLGATVASVTSLLSKDFIKLVVISLVIASPVAWYFMNRWLQDFAYRIHISWWVFAITAFTALSIAFATVSFQAIKAALANPVKSLRTE
jgi:putative ABC transport system permease protein